MTVYSDVWGEAEKPGTMMDTRTFIRDDQLGLDSFAKMSGEILLDT